MIPPENIPRDFLVRSQWGHDHLHRTMKQNHFGIISHTDHHQSIIYGESLVKPMNTSPLEK